VFDCSQSERALLPQLHFGQGFVIEDIVACVLQLQQWNYVGKTLAQNAHRWFLHATAARSLLLLKAHMSQDDLTALRAVSPTDGLMALSWLHEDTHAFARRLNFKCYCRCHSCE
jgi:hypothetical protein